MTAIIDRFEGSYAIVVLQDGTAASISKSLLPTAKEGDVVEIKIKADESQISKNRISNKVSKLFE